MILSTCPTVCLEAPKITILCSVTARKSGIEGTTDSLAQIDLLQVKVGICHSSNEESTMGV